MKSLVKISKGEKLLYEGNEVVVNDFVLVPNGAYDPRTVCIIYATKENGNVISATSDKFSAIEDEEYLEFYPTEHLFEVNKKVNKYHRLKQILIANGWAFLITLAVLVILMALNVERFYSGWFTGSTYIFTSFFVLLKQRNISL